MRKTKFEHYFLNDENVQSALKNEDLMGIVTACTDYMILNMKFRYRGENIHVIKDAINSFLYTRGLSTHGDAIDWIFEPEYGEGASLYKDFFKQRIILNIKNFEF